MPRDVRIVSNVEPVIDEPSIVTLDMSMALIMPVVMFPPFIVVRPLVLRSVNVTMPVIRTIALESCTPLLVSASVLLVVPLLAVILSPLTVCWSVV